MSIYTAEILELMKAINCKLQQQLEQRETLPQEIRPNAVYTTAEAAALLRLSSRTMRALADSQKVKHQRVGLGKTAAYRFMGRALLDFMNPPHTNPHNAAELQSGKALTRSCERPPLAMLAESRKRKQRHSSIGTDWITTVDK